MITSLQELTGLAKRTPGGIVSVAAAHDRGVVEAAAAARREGIADAVLVGHVSEIAGFLKELGEDPADYRMTEADTDRDCAEKAVAEIRNGAADFLMKGMLPTADLMRAVLDKERGLRTGRLLSHIMAFEVPACEKLLFLTDGGINTFPDYEQKEAILENAAAVLRSLGYERIYAACVCGAETVDPKVVSMTDAVRLSQSARWDEYHMTVYGPVGLDLAVSRDSCRHKNYRAPGAGEADLLLVPTYEVGNGIGKALLYFAGAEDAGVVVGAKVPIILVSRSDSPESKLASIALAKVVR